MNVFYSFGVGLLFIKTYLVEKSIHVKKVIKMTKDKEPNMKRSHKVKLALIIVIVIIIALSAGVIKKGKVLVIEDKRSGVYKELYLEDDSFILSYTHSVHKTIFQEYFIVTEDNQFLLEKNVFDSFGVGSPTIENPENFTLENGKFVYILNRTLKEFDMVISPIPDHKLTINDQVFDIIDFLNEDTNSIKLYPTEKYIITIGSKHKIL